MKLPLEFAHRQRHTIPEISTVASLAVIGTVLALTTVASILKFRPHPIITAHAGSLARRSAPKARACRSDQLQPTSGKTHREYRTARNEERGWRRTTIVKQERGRHPVPARSAR